MEFLKINKFAGIISILFFCLFSFDNANANDIYFIDDTFSLIKKSGINLADPEININTELNGTLKTGIIVNNNLFYVATGYENQIYLKDLNSTNTGIVFTESTEPKFYMQSNGNYLFYNDGGQFFKIDLSNLTPNNGTLFADLRYLGVNGSNEFGISKNGDFLIFRNPSSSNNLFRVNGSGELVQITNIGYASAGRKNGFSVDDSGNLFYETASQPIYKIDDFLSDDSIKNGTIVPGTSGGDYPDFNIYEDDLLATNNGAQNLYFLNISTGDSTKISDKYIYSYVNLYGVGTQQPSEISINGLSCKSEIIPDLENVTWYGDFMDNTGFLSSVDDDGWIRFFSWSGSIDDLPEAEYVNRAGLFYADQTAGGNFASGSLNYPGTARTTIRGGNESPLLLSFSDSEVKPNVVQWHGVNSVALGYAGTVQFRNTKNQDTNEVPISESGGVATAVISGNDRIRKVLLNYSSGFNGFRYGVAPVISKSSCSYKYNLCEWSIEGENTVCQSGNLVGGIPAGNCVLTSSGSVYGSGSCVPETTASGAIIPPILVPGVTVYDSEGNAVGNIYENESPVPDFSCGFADDDGWTDTIGKGIKCFFNLIQTSIFSTKDGINTIQGTSQTLGQSVDINPTTSTGSATGALSNPLLAQLKGVEEEASEAKYLKMTFGFFVFFFTILLVAVLATVLKGGIKRYFNQ